MKKQGSEPYEIIEFNLAVNGRAHFESFLNDQRFVPSHWHDSLEIISLTEGELMVNIEGKQYHLHEGDCIILPPYSVHSTLSTKGNSALLLQIPADAFSDCLGTLGKNRIICDPFTEDEASQAGLKRIMKLLFKIMDLKEENGPAAGLKSAGVLLDILYEVYSVFSDAGYFSSDPASSRKNRERLSAVMAYTEKHYMEPVTLSDVAGELHLQVNYFCHIFKENTGMTYLQYLNEYRLGRIYQDLVETEIPLKYLLERHGFNNYKLFRRMFSEHFGRTPGEIRKNAI